MTEKLEGHEVEKAKKQIDALINDHPTLKTSLATIQNSADAATKKIDTLYDAALTAVTDEEKKPELKTKAIDNINAVVALEKEEIAKLVTSKKELDKTVATALEKKFSDVKAWTALPDGNTSDKAPAAAPTTTKKSKKELFYENTSNTLFQENMKKIEKQTTLKDGVDKNTVLTNIKNLVDKLPDDKKKDAVAAFEAIQKDGKGIQPGTDGGLRADFIKKASAALVGSPNTPTLDECVAAENAWRLLSNHFRIGTKDPIQWKILTLNAGVITEGEAPADSGPAATPAATSTDDPANNADAKKTDEVKPEEKPPVSPAANAEVKTSLEWNATNKEKIVSEVMKEALSSLQKVSPVDFSAGKSLEFTANGKKCSMDSGKFTYGDKLANFSLLGNNVVTMYGDKNLPIKQLKYQSATDANLIVDASVLGGVSTHSAAMKEVELKRFMTAVLGTVNADSTAEKSIPIPVDAATVHLQIS